MIVYYEPSDLEYEEAFVKFQALLAKHTGQEFKIGRCVLVDAESLTSRAEYNDAEVIHGVWSGSRGKCAVLEKDIILWAMENYPDLCMNKQGGSGPQSEEAEHLVYVVFW